MTVFRSWDVKQTFEKFLTRENLLRVKVDIKNRFLKILPWIKFIASLLACLLIFYYGNYSIGSLPPLAKFFNPFGGFWQNNRNMDRIPEKLLFSELEDTVVVCWDDRRVAHIFARHNHDAFFMQGYLTARDRLWQMEFQTHVTAGRLAEIIGRTGLEMDRFNRRIGLTRAAERTLSRMLQDTLYAPVVQAYTAGVNAYINSLSAHQYPIEYKILDYKPEPWTPLKIALLLKKMAWDLTGIYMEAAMEKARIHYPGMYEQMYPDIPPFNVPIIPGGTLFDFKPLIPRIPPDSFKPVESGPVSPLPLLQLPDQFPGSNNWVIGSKKSANGLPILANDPHLKFTLPSIWYEIQISTPEMNVYGFSLPGAPNIVIGFNTQIAWGVTNAETDVLDWFSIKFLDVAKSIYQYNNQVKYAERRIETIKIRGADSFIDSVYYTVHGPVVNPGINTPLFKSVPLAAAMRWTGHDSSDEGRTFLLINRAQNYDQFAEALQSFDTPAQNFIFASRGNDIAIWHSGKIPLRWRNQGKFFLPGHDPQYEWQGFIPRSQLPHSKNPEQGFLSSANQYPVDTRYPYSLRGNYAPFERSTRIKEYLSEKTGLFPEDLMVLQTDIYNLFASRTLPVFLKDLQTKFLVDDEWSALESLRRWNYDQYADSIAPAVFNYWWREFSEAVWADEVELYKDSLPYPRSDATLRFLINDPENEIFDNFFWCWPTSLQ